MAGSLLAPAREQPRRHGPAAAFAPGPAAAARPAGSAPGAAGGDHDGRVKALWQRVNGGGIHGTGDEGSGGRI